MLVPVVMATVVGYAIKKAWSRPQGMTPARTKLYQEALRSLDASNLRDLAVGFRAEGLNAEALQLEKRARLRELPEAARIARKKVQTDLLAKDKPEDIPEILEYAQLYEDDGAVGSAETLRKHAEAIKNASS